MNNCNLTTCRYNAYGKCTNEEKRKECVDVSRKVLYINEIQNKNEFLGEMAMKADKVVIEIENQNEYAPIKVIIDGKEIKNVVKIDFHSEYASGRTTRSLVIEKYGEWYKNAQGIPDIKREKIKIEI